MTWTTPRTWTPGELVTADLLNTHLRDNLLYIYGRLGIGVRVARTADQQLSPLAWTAFGFTTARYDTDNMFDGLNPSYLTVNTPGKYLVSGHIKMPGRSERREIRIMLNGSTQIARHTEAFNGSGEEIFFSLATVYHFNAGDTIAVEIYSGANVAVNAPGSANAAHELAAQWLGE